MNKAHENSARPSDIAYFEQRKLEYLAKYHPNLLATVQAGMTLEAAYRQAKGQLKVITIALDPAVAAKTIKMHFNDLQIAELKALL